MKSIQFSRVTFLSCILLLFVLANTIGCATTGRRHKAEVSSSDADSLYARLGREYASGQFEAAEATANRLLEGAAGFEHREDVLMIAARSSFSKPDLVQAVKYAQAVVDDYPLGRHREEALFVIADAYRELEKFYESADALLQLLASALDPEMEGRALNMLKILSQEQLGISDLERLVTDYPSSPLAGDMSLALAKREFARGNYDGAYTLLAQLLYQFPQHKRSPEVRQLLRLSANRRENPDQRLDYVEPNKIGVVLPITGNFSRYGRYFEQGIEIALQEFNASRQVTVAFVRADSRGNPVDAVDAVRRLVIEEGVLAVLGSVLAVPTVAAAVECNASRVAILAPVPTAQRIDEIGPWVFQTKVSGEIEVSAMARVAREELLLERFAVLAPASNQKLAEYFVQEITSRGGTIVAMESYQDGASDFREQLEIIREASPEALFIPGEPEELILMLPQISFYDLQIQLIGLSNWNSEKLLRLSQAELEGAIFPSEALHGKDRNTYQQFVADYREHFGGDVHPVATAGYFGMKLLLQSIAEGAIDRTQIRDFLERELNAGAEQRMAEASSLSILNVRSGKVLEFRTSLREP